MKKTKGSLSIEAVISVTVFLGVSFLLLTLVKLVLFMTILNNATVEAAKTIATTAGYPLAILNGLQEDLENAGDVVEQYKPQNLAQTLSGGGGAAFNATVFGNLLSGASGMQANIQGMAGAKIKELIGGIASNAVMPLVYQQKSAAASYICGEMVKGYVENCGLAFDQEKVMLRAVKIPETDKEFTTLHGGSAINLSEDGSLTATAATSPTGNDGAFNAGDVVVCLEYPYQIALPFLPSFEVTLRSVSVEHAWLHCTNTGPSRTEGINLETFFSAGKDAVYEGSGGTGKKYHKENCMTLWRGSERISLASAKGKGLTPCKLCFPENNT